jgi:hypothetical protein
MRWLFVFFFLTPALYGQETVDDSARALARLATVSTHPELIEKVKQILAHDERRFNPKCQEFGPVQPAHISVFEAPTFSDQGVPLTGHWMIRYQLNACGKDVLRAINFVADGNGVELKALLPGNTQADPQLQKDVGKAFKMAALKSYPDCQTPFIADTRLLSLPENGDAPWEELWVADVCGTIFGQAIRFVPQEEGTAFALDVATNSDTQAEEN